MTNKAPLPNNTSWNLPIRRAPAHVKIKVASTLEMMRFSGNVVDTYLDAMGQTVLGFLQTINSSQIPDFMDEDWEADTENENE